ncbi:MAG: hypothetical protein J6L01_07360 [Alistipes sp.]|nr:hypothetical protein [Alistipes sp.]
MDIWRKIQIAAVVLTVIAIVLTIVAVYYPSAVYCAMWAWSIALWSIMFLGPMPVINRNRSKSKIARELMFFVAVFIAISIYIWLKDVYPETHGFSQGVLVYSVVYLIVGLAFAAWLKLEEKKNR